MTNIAADLRAALCAGQAATAVEAPEPVPATTLWSLTDQFAGALRADDVGRGDEVAIQLASPLELLVAVYGTLRNGSVPVVLPTDFEPAQAIAALAATEPPVLVSEDPRVRSLLATVESLRVLVTHDLDRVTLGVAFEEYLDDGGLASGGSRTGTDLVRRRDDDVALVAFTGDGDEQTPRGVVFSHDALRQAVRAGCSIPLGTDVRRHLGTHPLDRSIGLVYGATATILDGGCYAPLEFWDADAAREALAGDVDRAYLTPEQYRELDAVTESVPAGIFVVDPTDEAAAAQRGDVHRLCALPETGITHCRTPAAVADGRLGQPIGPVETTVIGNGSGELAIASEAAMTSYLDSGRTAAAIREIDGKRWIKTGARARVTDGGFYLCGRPEPA